MTDDPAKLQDHTAPIVRFAAEVLGFELFPGQREILDEIYRDGIRVAVLRLGRRSGKGRIAAVAAVYEATVNAPAHLAAVPSGERVSIVIVATSQAQARIVHGYVRSFLQAPALAPLIVRDVEDEIMLSNGVSIVTMPCTARSTRGLAVAVLILDEAAWMMDTDSSAIAAEEVWQATVPSTVQFPAGRVLVLSTPRWSTGWFADLCRQASSGEFPDMRAWHRSTSEMNPSISASFLATERARDPDLFRREYEAHFNSATDGVFPESEIRAAVVDRGDLPPVEGRAYKIAVDAAFTGDAFALIVGHREPDGRVVIDRVSSWRGTSAHPVPIDPTLDAIAGLARAYGHGQVIIDQFSAETIRQGLAGRGISVLCQPWSNDNKNDAVAAVRRVLFAGRLELPNHPALIGELITLEGRPLPSGRIRVAAPGRAHDDFASALMALVADLAADAWSTAAIAFAYGQWICPRDGLTYPWAPGRPCPQCGLPAPDQYDRPAQ